MRGTPNPYGPRTTGGRSRPSRSEEKRKSAHHSHVARAGAFWGQDGMAPYASSPPANRPDDRRTFPSQLNFFGFMADRKAIPLTQRVFHLVQSDFDFQHLGTVCHGKQKYGVVFRRATWR